MMHIGIPKLNRFNMIQFHESHNRFTLNMAKNNDLLLVLNLANRVVRIGKHCLAIHYRMFGPHQQALLRWQVFSIIAYHYINKICV